MLTSNQQKFVRQQINRIDTILQYEPKGELGLRLQRRWLVDILEISKVK
jgi:hypothetical protein